MCENLIIIEFDLHSGNYYILNIKLRKAILFDKNQKSSF